jgi:hypothetical protein
VDGRGSPNSSGNRHRAGQRAEVEDLAALMFVEVMISDTSRDHVVKNR